MDNRFGPYDLERRVVLLGWKCRSLPGLLLVLIGAWIAMGLFFSILGGWRKLARTYDATEPIRGEQFWMKSAGMRYGVGCRSCLNFGVDVHGLFVSVVPLFRIGFPPLVIPWSDIIFTKQSGWLFGGVRLNFRRCPDVPILLAAKVAEQVFARAPIKPPAT